MKNSHLSQQQQQQMHLNNSNPTNQFHPSIRRSPDVLLADPMSRPSPNSMRHSMPNSNVSSPMAFHHSQQQLQQELLQQHYQSQNYKKRLLHTMEQPQSMPLPSSSSHHQLKFPNSHRLPTSLPSSSANAMISQQSQLLPSNLGRLEKMHAKMQGNVYNQYENLSDSEN